MEKVPESIAFFFNGEPMAGKAEKMMGEFYSDAHVLTFIGPYAPPVPPLDKEHLKGAMGNLIGSFPDLTFNFTKVEPKKMADGGWAADIIVMGTHTGAAFSPMPGMLPAIDTTSTQVKIGPETFTLYADPDGKVTKTTIEPLHPGAPAGPPGFYTEIGGVIPWSPAPDAVFHRLTKIPIKPGSIGDIVKVADSAPFQETIKTFVGFLGVEALSVDDSTMMTHSRWVSEEACTGGAQALGMVLKEHLAEFIAGPPDAPWVGPGATKLDIADNGKAAAYRVVVMKLKENTMGAVSQFATSKLPEFKAIEGLLSITAFSAGSDAAVVCAAYTSKEALEAATPKIGVIMKEMGEKYFAGPPTPFLTEVSWTTF